jgi:hypothetical protein
VNLPEPPEFPPPSATPPPPPAAPPAAPPPPPGVGAAPAGYVPYAAAQPLRPTRGLGKAVSVMYKVAAASSMLTAIAVFHRKTVVQDIVDRGGQVTAADVSADDRARALLITAVVVSFLLLLAGGIITAIWANRVAKNAVARGALGVNPGMAAGGWFIPIGSWFLGFRELTRSVEGLGRHTTSIRNWQIAFVVTTLFGWLTRNLGGDPGSLSELANTLNSQFFLSLLAFVLYLVSAILGAKAIREIDDVVSPA